MRPVAAPRLGTTMRASERDMLTIRFSANAFEWVLGNERTIGPSVRPSLRLSFRSLDTNTGAALLMNRFQFTVLYRTFDTAVSLVLSKRQLSHSVHECVRNHEPNANLVVFIVWQRCHSSEHSVSPQRWHRNQGFRFELIKWRILHSG